MSQIKPAFGPSTGRRDQGLVQRANPADAPEADGAATPTRAQIERDKRDRERVAKLPPTRAVIETNAPDAIDHAPAA